MPSIVDLIVADATDLALSALATNQWGVFLDGSPVITPATPVSGLIESALAPVELVASLLGVQNLVPVTASTISFEFAADSPVPTYPLEDGGFQSYDKVVLPFDVKLRLAGGGSPSRRQAFLSTCLAIRESLALFDIVTPEIVFTSSNCIHLDWRRTADHGTTLIAVDLYFQQINVADATTFSSTQQPGSASPQGIGNVQPVPNVDASQLGQFF